MLTILATALALSCSILGPLKVHPTNPRYFANGCGQPVYLTGSHTHLSFKSGGDRPPGTYLDYNRYLDVMMSNNQNFIRLWSGWELDTYSPQPWAKKGGKSILPRSTRTKELRQRVIAAREKNIYVSVMLFEGWLLRFRKGALKDHPFFKGNNVNGIDVDGSLLRVHTLENRAITALQERYLMKVIDTLNDLDNVLYEVANESEFPLSVKWQYHIINVLKQYQAKSRINIQSA